MKIIVSRHGKTDWNEKSLLCGQTDAPVLVEKGLLQAEKIAEVFGGRKIDRIISSPLTRAIQTAMPLARKLGISIETDKRLLDVNTGSFVGRTEEESLNLLKIIKVDFSQGYPGGESYSDVYRRVSNLIDELEAACPEKTVYLQGHGAFMRCALIAGMGEDMSLLSDVDTKNSFVFEIDTEKRQCSWINVLTGEAGTGIRWKKPDYLKK
jgi:broad specificity phosphatase PhoE